MLRSRRYISEQDAHSEQHIELKHALAQQCHKVSLHTILMGVIGTIYKYHTELPLSKLGLVSSTKTYSQS